MTVSEFRFDNLPFSIQTMIFSALVVCLMFVFYACYLKDLLKERDVIQDEITKLEAVVSKKTYIENQLECLRQDLVLMEKQLEALKRILPAQKETPAVLKSVQQMAASSSLKIRKLTPKPVIPRLFYSEWPIQLEVEGNYDGLGLFFEKVSRATRIIDIGTLSIKGSENYTNQALTLTASCTATAFVFREEMQETPAESESQKAGSADNRGKLQR
jgi:Tfp pilus assembly protein PilO